ncbi:MAG TPA: hypothetical protein PKH10_01520 [bacterium]|nr:hypothetical protein [bacterium]
MFRKIIDDYHTTLFLGIMLALLGIIESARNVLISVLGMPITSPLILLGLGVFNVILAFAFFIMGARNIEAAEEVAHTPRPAGNEKLLAERIAELETRLSRLERGAKDGVS